jgi:hemoglobin
MRHAPFVIGPVERDLWLKHMGEAVLSLELPEELERPLWDYLAGAAHAMQNAAESPAD